MHHSLRDAGNYTGLNIIGEVRDVKMLRAANGKSLFIFARNNDKCILAEKVK